MRQTILLADDSSTIQRLVTQTFADTRFDIVAVNNGGAAIRKFEEIRPDVVLADIYMPGKNGFEVCAHIREHATLAGTPVILLVGAYDPFDISTANRAGATDHITKPFEPRALIDMVKAVLSGAPRPARDPASPPQEETAKVVAAAETPAAAAAPPDFHATPATISVPAMAAAQAPAPPEAVMDTGDLLGLEALFQPQVVTVPVEVPRNLSVEEIDSIADRVIHKLSSQIVENIAWDVVPDIAIKVLRDELKKTTHEG
jgi:DNA-binding response OmpR family regulator